MNPFKSMLSTGVKPYWINRQITVNLGFTLVQDSYYYCSIYDLTTIKLDYIHVETAVQLPSTKVDAVLKLV